MKTLSLHIVRQVSASLLVCVGVFYFLLLLGNVLRDILDLLATRAATPAEALAAIGYLSPFVLAFALPISLLTAVLLVFGRLSADQEITAARASGMSLISMALPVLGLSLGLSVLCAWFNTSLGPNGRTTFTQLRDTTLKSRANLLLRENTYCRLGDVDIYVSRIDTTNLYNILLYQHTNSVKMLEIKANEGHLLLGTNGTPLGLELIEASTLSLQGNEWLPGYNDSIQIPLRTTAAKPPSARYSDMPLAELLAKRREVRATGRQDLPLTVQIHRQIAFSFACVGFAMIGIPLGIRAHRRETNIGVAMALGLVLAYYSFIILAQSLETRADLYPHLLMWVPNFLFQGIGAWLLWKANRGP